MSNFFKTKIAGEQILDGAVKRQNLDTSIVSDIDTLKENDITKASDISQLQTDVAAEEAARVSADAALGIRVDGVEGDLAAEVARAQAAEAQVLSDANSYTDGKVADLVNSAPAVLDTLKELSDALGGDENFAVTVANNIGEVAADVAAEETRALAAEAALASDIAAEVTRAQGAETQLSNSLSAEVTRAQGAEAGLASDIAAEESARQAADTTLQGNIDAEETRALAAEGVLQGNIDAEESRAQGAEAGLASDIAAEETRAIAAEGALGIRVDGVEGDLAAEVTRAQGAESSLSGRITVLEQDPTTKTYVDQQVAGLVNSAPAVLDTLKELADAIGEDPNFSATISGMVGEVAADLAAEVTRAQGAEAGLASDISAEVTRATGVEADLASDIADEASARQAADTTLQGNIDAEETRALAAEGALGVRIDGVEGDLAAEVTRAQGAEAGLASDIAAEETRAVAAETTLQANIDSEEARAMAAEAAVAADLVSEIGNRESADSALGVRIDGVESDLASEVTSRESADTALSTRISALESDATTKTYVDQKFAEVIDNAPAVLDTLNELAQAIGDDPAFITNINSTIDAVSADLAAEVTRAQGAEAGLASDISAEETRALAAEGDLASDISAEESRAMGVEAGLASDIAALDGRVTTLEDSAYIIREVPAGLVNGVNTVFQLDSVPSAGTEQVFLNGLLQEAGANGDYTITGDTITFGVAPSTGYSLVVSYVTGAPVFNSGSGSSSGFSGDYNDLTNKPTLFSGSYADLTGKPSLFSGDYNDLSNKPSIPSLTSVESRITSLEADATTKTYVDAKVADLVASAPAVLDTLNELAQAINSDPSFATTVSNSIGAISARVTTLEGVSFATVATTGSYTDLTNKPSLFSGSYTDLTNKPSLFSGSYTDLTDKPTIPSLIDDLSDVTITTPAADQFLKYNGTAWVNSALPSATAVLSGVVTANAQSFGGQKTFLAGTILQANSAGVIPATVRAAASQTANLFQIQNSSQVNLFVVDASGNVVPPSVSTKALNLKALASQTAAIFDVQSSAGTSLVTVNASGNLGLSNGAVATPALHFLNSTNMGIYRKAANVMGFVANGQPGMMVDGASGVGRLAVGDIATVVSRFQLADDGFTSTSGITFGTSASTYVQMYRSANNTLALSGGLSVTNSSSTVKGLVVKGAASQSVNLVEVQNSAGTALATIGSDGTVHSARYTETVANAFSTTLAPATGTLTVDTSLGNAVLGTLNASVTTWAFTNVPTDNSKVTTITAVIAGNASYTYGDACSVNGSSVSGGIMWSGGSAPTSTAGTDIITFVIVRDSAGTIKVFGSATTNFS